MKTIYLVGIVKEEVQIHEQKVLFEGNDIIIARGYDTDWDTNSERAVHKFHINKLDTNEFMRKIHPEAWADSKEKAEEIAGKMRQILELKKQLQA